MKIMQFHIAHGVNLLGQCFSPLGGLRKQLTPIRIYLEGVIWSFKTLGNKGICMLLLLQIQSQQHQHYLHCLAQWETTWGMAFHPDKCNVLRVTRRKGPVSYSYSLKGHQLEEVTTAKY